MELASPEELETGRPGAEAKGPRAGGRTWTLSIPDHRASHRARSGRQEGKATGYRFGGLAGEEEEMAGDASTDQVPFEGVTECPVSRRCSITEGARLNSRRPPAHREPSPKQ
jgi:hypothetical protein